MPEGASIRRQMKRKTEEIEIALISKVYELSLGEYSITASVNEEGISLRTGDNHDCFEFDNSDPKAVEAIGKLFVEVGRLK